MKRKTILIILAAMIVFAVSGIIGSEYYAARPEFCGLCHTSKKPFDSWAKSGHRDVKCVDCHFAPGKESFLKAGFRGLEHLFASLSPDAEAIEVRVPSKVSSLGCATSQCHPAKKFLNRKIDSAENVPFTHKPHEDRIIEGAALNCGTCHFNMTLDKDHAVSREACYLCLALTHILKVGIE